MNDKILWGQIAAVGTIVILAVWAATQWTAAALGFQSALGAPWFRIGDYPVYPPPAFFWWWFVYDAYAPPIFYRGAMIAASGGFISIIVAIAMSVWRARERRRAETYGSARWADAGEIRRAGMLGDSGVILGRYRRHYLRHDGAEHILCFAPTRSGKGVGLVVPTLLTWPGSCIVHDIIIESCPTRIFLPNERAAEPQIARVYDRFGLNSRQIEILSRATPKRDYYCQSRRGNRLFDLGLGDIALAFAAASSKSDQIRIGELMAAHGQQQFAAAWLRHRGLTWAADLLGNLEIAAP